MVFAAAEEHFKAALALEPDFALGYAGSGRRLHSAGRIFR